MEAKRLKILKVEKVDCSNYVYDIHMIDTPHTFFANNILVHNTDSCFFEDGYVDIDFFVDEFNRDLKTSFIDKYNNGPIDDYRMLELEYEKHFDHIYFGDSKKRYYGIVSKTGEKYIKGLNIIRKDSPPFLKERLNEYSEMAVVGKLTLQHIIDLRKEVESQPYETIAVTKAFGKRFQDYKATQPQHLKGAKFANEKLGTKITHKDTPLLFYINSLCEDDLKLKDRCKAICLLSDDLHYIDDNDGVFEIDYTTYFAKQVITPLKEFEHIPEVKEILTQYKESLK